MAELERSTAAAAPATQSHADEGLPALFGRLGDNVMELLDTKLNLLKIEVKEDATAYVKSGAMIGVGAVIAGVGLTLLLVAIAFFVSMLFPNEPPLNYALGFLVTSIIFIAIGGALVYVMKNRMTARNPAPQRSIEEIRKDKQWLKNEN